MGSERLRRFRVIALAEEHCQVGALARVLVVPGPGLGRHILSWFDYIFDIDRRRY